MEKTKFRRKKKKNFRELSGSKFHSVTSSSVILYNDVKNSIFTKSGFYQVLEINSFQLYLEYDQFVTDGHFFYFKKFEVL